MVHYQQVMHSSVSHFITSNSAMLLRFHFTGVIFSNKIQNVIILLVLLESQNLFAEVGAI